MEGGSDDKDSYEAQLRLQDHRDFRMDEIEAGHEERLRLHGPYRILPRLLQSGAATPSRGAEDLPDVPSRPTSALAPWNALSSAVSFVGSRAATPEYDGPPTSLSLPDPESRSLTDGRVLPPVPLHMPLQREFTPMTLPPLLLTEACPFSFFLEECS